MTEVEKMRSSQLADMAVPELQVRFEHAKKLLARMRGMSTYDAGYRELLEELVPDIPETSIICPPFHCDHGDGIKLGEHVFVNANRDRRNVLFSGMCEPDSLGGYQRHRKRARSESAACAEQAGLCGFCNKSI